METVPVAGLGDVAAGYSETYSKMISKDLAGCLEGNKEKNASSIIVSIKNVMSDRHVVQKAFNKLLSDCRTTVMPSVIDEKVQMSTLNEFFCGLHFVVGLADQAKAAFKVWDKILYGDQPVGSLSHGGYSKSERGTLRLVRTVCKAVQERGCEKSGRPVQFLTFFAERNTVNSVF